MNDSPENRTVIFVDRGDMARAPIAAAITRKALSKKKLLGHFSVGSCRTQGVAPDDMTPVRFPNLTYYPEYSHSRQWLEKHGIDFSRRLSDAIVPWVAEKADVIFTMDEKTRTSLLLLFPECEEKIHMFWEISEEGNVVEDPDGIDDQERVEQIYDSIRDTINAGLPKLLELANATGIENARTRSAEWKPTDKERL